MKDLWFKKSTMESFIFPVVVLFILVVGVPFLIRYHSIYTTQYVFIFIIGFFVVFIRIFSLLNLHIKFIDIILTVPIIIISSVLLFILGFCSLFIVLIRPSLVYRVGYTLSLIITFSLGANLRFKGVTLPKDKQFVLVANHTSFLDEVLAAIAAGERPWTIIFAQEIKRVPILGKFLRDYGISVDRDDLNSKKIALDRSEKEIKKGKNFFLFAEGKRLRPDDFEKGIVLYPFKSGAFSLACEHNLPVYPVVFLFPFYFKPRSGRWWFSPRTITIINLEPIYPTGKTPKELMEEVHGAMENELRFNLGK